MSGAETSNTTRAKRRMTLEEAVSWAFRDEEPKMREDKGKVGPALSAMHPMWRSGAFGSRIDNWNNVDPGFPLAMGPPHPDAVLIINAVRGIDVEKLDLYGFHIPYRIGENFDLNGVLEKARRDTVAVITRCATSRSRPDVSDAVRVQPVRALNGQVTVWLKQLVHDEDVSGNPITVPVELPTGTLNKKKGVYPTGAYTKIVCNPSAATVALDRARHVCWYTGLEQAAEHLRVIGLQNIEITGFDAPAMPWVDAPEPVVAATIVESLLPPSEDRLIGARTMPETAIAGDDVTDHTLAIRHEVLANRRNFGRRQRPRRASEVRHIDPRSYAPAETG